VIIATSISLVPGGQQTCHRPPALRRS